jgi:hypothetical protein
LYQEVRRHESLHTQPCPGSGEWQGWRGGKGHDVHTSITHSIVAKLECDICVSHLYKWALRVVNRRGCRTLPRLPKGTKNHHCTNRVMVDASSHVPLYSVVESTLRVYVRRIIVVSERTNKSHHHQDSVIFPPFFYFISFINLYTSVYTLWPQ